MRFKRKKKPELLDTRIRSCFLFFPKELATDEGGIEREVRWLEYAAWLEEYRTESYLVGESDVWVPLYWVPISQA